ncbi:AAA domain-containing protein [Tenacibaculum sp. 190130A14a]|uniref:AAA domain-containing protein n=1 Tax=Tenacibaculum polynesiense TaxID=3137857 RepID=A0ABP1EZQ8_9FLAO
MIANYISYFHKCYQADNKETGVLNFFSSKYENQFIIKTEEELVNNKYPLQFIPTKQAKDKLQTLELFKNDKELWYGSLFCTGKRSNFRKKTTSVVAPLFIYKAAIEKKDGDYFVRINHESRQLNIAFCRSLLFKTSFDDFFTEIEMLLEYQPYITFGFIGQLQRVVEKHIVNLTFDTDFLLYPKLKNQTYIKKQLQNTKDVEQFTTIASAGIFVSSRANNINSVVNELEVLKNNPDYSQGLQAFFSSELQQFSFKLNEPIKIPLLLNSAQERIVQNASNYDKSVIFGPPGTGKTYTINAIAQDYVSKGKSVLIVTKTAQALQVVSDKLMSSKIGDFSVKVGGNYYKRTLLAKLRRIINGNYYKENHKTEAYKARLKKNQLYDKLVQLEKDFTEKTERDISRMEKYLSESFVQKTLSKIDILFIHSFERDEWNIIQQYFDTLTLFEKSAKDDLFKNLISTIIWYSNKELQKLITLSNIIQTDEKSLVSKQLQSLNAKPLTHFLPVWLVKIDEIATSLPLQKELFDIAIVDEATQCDIASCLPVFQRAKKVVVAGDTNQLRHISFLSKTQMYRFQQQEGINDAVRFDYRKKSLLDFTLEHTAKGNQIVLLDEHYRSLPDIIRFSNHSFYGEALRIMTQTPSNKEKQAVFLHKTNGVQDDIGVNKKEARRIVQHIQKIVKAELETHKNLATSIGVLSPFRQQTNYLTKLIKETFELATIKKHQIKLGTPYHFQGEERDVMLLSMAVSSQSHFASLNYLNKEDVFNVAITRARNEQHIFYSVEPKELPEKSQLRHYLSSFEQKVIPQPVSNVIDDSFSKEIQAFLKPFNTTIHVGYVIAGLSIDLLLEKDHKYLGIDLIGYPGSYTTAFDIERYRILHRVGIQIVPISYLSWKYNKEDVVKLLTTMMKSLA